MLTTDPAKFVFFILVPGYLMLFWMKFFKSFYPDIVKEIQACEELFRDIKIMSCSWTENTSIKSIDFLLSKALLISLIGLVIYYFIYLLYLFWLASPLPTTQYYDLSILGIALVVLAAVIAIVLYKSVENFKITRSLLFFLIFLILAVPTGIIPLEESSKAIYVSSTRFLEFFYPLFFVLLIILAIIQALIQHKNYERLGTMVVIIVILFCVAYESGFRHKVMAGYNNINPVSYISPDSSASLYYYLTVSCGKNKCDGKITFLNNYKESILIYGIGDKNTDRFDIKPRSFPIILNEGKQSLLNFTINNCEPKKDNPTTYHWIYFSTNKKLVNIWMDECPFTGGGYI